jgi:hypothetical protein
LRQGLNYVASTLYGEAVLKLLSSPLQNAGITGSATPTHKNYPVLEGVVAAIRKPSELDAFLKNGLSLPSSQMSSI